MNSLLLLALLAAVAIARAQPPITDPKLKEIFMNCQKESKVTEQELQAFFKNPMDPSVATNNVKCHMKCCMEKTGLLKDGQLVEATVLDTFSKVPDTKLKPDDIKKGFAACKAEKGADDCDTAFKITGCFHKNGLMMH